MAKAEESAGDSGAESTLGVDFDGLVVVELTEVLDLFVKFEVAAVDGPVWDGGMIENLNSFELWVVVVGFLSVKSGGFGAVAFGRDDNEMTGG